MTKQNASKQIADKVEQIRQLVRECEEIADDNGVSFSLNATGAYGAGASYEPRHANWNSSSCSPEDQWESSGCSDGDYEEGVWESSSSNC